MDPSRGDSRYNLNYSMSSIGLSLADQADLYGNPAAAAALGGGRPPSGGLIQTMGGGGLGGLSGRSSSGLMSNSSQCQSLSNPSANSTGGGGPGQQQQQQSRGIKRTSSDCYDDHHRGGGGSGGMSAQMQGLDSCASSGNGQQQQQGGGANVSDVVDDSYNSMQNKKSPPANGKKTKGRVKIKMEYIDNKLRRYTTFSKRKTGIMKKAYELSTLTGTQVMLLVASETGHVYTFATRKLQPMITSEAGKQLIQTCLNSPDPPSVGGGDQRMSATGFEETELSYNIADEDSKDDRSPISSANESDESSDIDSPGPSLLKNQNQILMESTHFKNASSTTVSTSLLTPTTSAANSQSQTSNIQQSQPETTTKISTMSSQTADGNILKSSAQTQKNRNPAGSAMGPSSSFNNVVYPATSLSSVPQEVLLQLIQSGHLQLHTEEDGSGHQYVTIPLSLPSSLPSSATNNGAIASNASSDVIDASEKSRNKIGTTAAASTQQSTATCSASNDVKIKQELID